VCTASRSAVHSHRNKPPPPLMPDSYVEHQLELRAAVESSVDCNYRLLFRSFYYSQWIVGKGIKGRGEDLRHRLRWELASCDGGNCIERRELVCCTSNRGRICAWALWRQYPLTDTPRQTLTPPTDTVVHLLFHCFQRRHCIHQVLRPYSLNRFPLV